MPTFLEGVNTSVFIINLFLNIFFLFIKTRCFSFPLCGLVIYYVEHINKFKTFYIETVF